MTTLVITISGGTEVPVDTYEQDDDESSCPIATRDEDVNEENKMEAVEDANYRDPSSDGGFRLTDVCGNCGAYNQTEDMLECIGDESGNLGYCQLYKFVCQAEHTCDKWVKGGPITSDLQTKYKDNF